MSKNLNIGSFIEQRDKLGGLLSYIMEELHCSANYIEIQTTLKAGENLRLNRVQINKVITKQIKPQQGTLDKYNKSLMKTFPKLCKTYLEAYKKEKSLIEIEETKIEEIQESFQTQITRIMKKQDNTLSELEKLKKQVKALQEENKRLEEVVKKNTRP